MQSNLHTQTAELYDEFLNLIESIDYSNNQIVLGEERTIDLNIKHIKCNNDQNRTISLSKSFPPYPGVHSGSTNRKAYSDYENDYHNLDQMSSDSEDEAEYFETVQKDLFHIHAFINKTSNDQRKDTKKFIGVSNFTLGLHQKDCQTELQNLLDLHEGGCTSGSIDSYEDENPVVPGLFPSMNIHDEDQFLNFDRLPLKPSYIVP